MIRFVLGLLIISAAYTISAAPVVTFGSSHVVATGITSRGRAAVIGVAHEPREFWTNIVHRQFILTDEAGTGTVRLDLDKRLSTDSGWAVVDLATGDVAIAAPENSPFVVVPFANGAVRRNDAGEFTRIVGDREYIDLVLVRPGEGAWLFYGEDGHSNDTDRERNGHTTIDPERMRPIGDSPAPPKHLKNGDRLVVIAPYARTIATVEVGR